MALSFSPADGERPVATVLRQGGPAAELKEMNAIDTVRWTKAEATPTMSVARKLVVM